MILLAATAHLFFPDDPFKLAGKPMSPPGTEGFLLGSDSLGRNVASGIAHGAKTSLLIGLLATLVAVGFGAVMGGLAGYYGGWIDDLLMRVTEMFQTIPSFVFAILLVAIMKPSIESIVIAIAVVSWPAVARLVRGEFLFAQKPGIRPGLPYAWDERCQNHARRDLGPTASRRSSSPAP